MTHPGVGARTAVAFVLIIGNAGRFQCGKQVASYLGLVPLEESSGNRQRLRRFDASRRRQGSWNLAVMRRNERRGRGGNPALSAFSILPISAPTAEEGSSRFMYGQCQTAQPRPDGDRSMVPRACHAPVDEQQKTLNAKLRGHYQYYGRPTNFQCLWKFYRGTCRLWHYWRNRRTRGSRLTRDHYTALLRRHPLLLPRICNPGLKQ